MTPATSFLTLGTRYIGVCTPGVYQVYSSQFLLFATGSKCEILIDSS